MEKNKTVSKGTLKISNDVVVKIAELAACEISGVAVDGQRLKTSEDSNFLGVKLSPPIRARLHAEAAEIDASIVVESGYKAINVAEAVQQSIKSAVQNMTGIVVSKVNVNIGGIEIKSEEE